MRVAAGVRGVFGTAVLLGLERFGAMAADLELERGSSAACRDTMTKIVSHVSR